MIIRYIYSSTFPSSDKSGTLTIIYSYESILSNFGLINSVEYI